MTRDQRKELIARATRSVVGIGRDGAAAVACPKSIDLGQIEEWRCVCSWVGGDPDERVVRGRLKITCPACWAHDHRRVEVKTQCPRCGAWSLRTCQVGDPDMHCDDERCLVVIPIVGEDP